ncbi:cytochrome P450 [Streptomyces sp. NPDC048387]|uniref:cytochrome P450 n=1 Tax=Streptomyces sp. NPDC048387 TaxID=3365542 RepID=UPI003712957D
MHAHRNGALDTDERSGLVVDLLIAGFNTISHQLSLALIAFSYHPHQWMLLREHPELGEQAVNEVLRYSPTATIWRHTAADLYHKGLLIPAGTPVHLSAHAARRDPHACPDGDIFDITRGRPTTLLAFGGGAHYCPGAALARTELAEALTALASRLGPPRITGPVTWRPPVGVSGPETLPLSFHPL